MGVPEASFAEDPAVAVASVALPDPAGRCVSTVLFDPVFIDGFPSVMVHHVAQRLALDPAVAWPGRIGDLGLLPASAMAVAVRYVLHRNLLRSMSGRGASSRRPGQLY